MSNDITRFEVGNTYAFVTHGDGASFASLFTVVKRTAKFVTLEDAYGIVARFGVYVWQDVEACRPWGTYSMCPILRADRVAVAA